MIFSERYRLAQWAIEECRLLGIPPLPMNIILVMDKKDIIDTDVFEVDENGTFWSVGRWPEE